MTDAQALLHAVCADPDNLTLRLIYADFLEDQGDPRAEFIRVQCELAGLDEDDDRRTPLEERELALLNKHGSAWVNQLELAYKPCAFRRGFVESLTMNAGEFLANAERLFRLTPLRQVSLISTASDLATLAASPVLARLSRLHLGPVGDTDVATLCTSSHLANLQSLTLSGHQLGLDGVRALLECPSLAGLRELGLYRSQQLAAAELELLARESNFRELELLHLESVRVGGAGLQALALSQRFPKLRTLKIRRCELTDAGVRALASSRTFPELTGLDLSGNNLLPETGNILNGFINFGLTRLRSLDLSGNPVGTYGARRLALSGHVTDLRRLSLRGCRLTAEAAQSLGEICATELRALDLSFNRIEHEGAEQLAQGSRLAGLRELYLEECGLTAWSARVLTWSPHLSELRVLHLDRNPIDDKVLQALGAEKFPLRPHLTTLNLNECSLTDEGIAAVHVWPKLPALCRLGLSGNNLTDDSARRLAESPLLAKLTHLNLSGTDITSDGVRMLLASPHGRRLQSLRLEGISLDDETRKLVRSRFFAQSYLRG
jgi:uncharacterized protein (TIGR02996 family)